MSELEQWFKERHVWIRSAANKILEKGKLNEDDYKELVDLCIKEVNGKLDEADEYDVDLLFDGVSSDGIRLRSLGNIKDINALAPKKPLEFGDSNLSIIYGQNGSGKSGYIRILKHICGSRKPGKLLPNVFEESQSEQKCDVTFELNGVGKTVNWDNKNGKIKELKTVDIYDTISGKVYVNEENEVSYEPPILEFFNELVNTADNLSAKIKKLIIQKPSKLPTISPHLQDTDLGKRYNELTHEITEETIESYTEWTEELRVRFKGLKERLAVESPADKAKKLLVRKKRLDELILTTIRHLRQLSDLECNKILELDRQAALKELAAEVAAKKIFATAPLEGVGAPVWERLWQKAREYSEQVAYRDEVFPFTEEESRCVLCHQSLSDDAKSRLQSFEDYVKGQLRKDAKEKRNDYDQALELIGVVEDSKFIETKLEALDIGEKDIIAEVDKLYEVLRNREQKITELENLDELAPIPDSWELLKKARKLSQSFYNKANEYLKDVEEETSETLSKELNELEAKEWLSKQKEAIKSEVIRLGEINSLNEAKKLTNPIALSRKKGVLAEELITEAYVERFNDELVKLRASWIKVELVKTRVEKGRVLHRIRLKNAEQQVPGEILSEGENRIVTLAAFLADVTGKDNPAPFVFDDPISSLDEDFEEAVVERLIELSKDRQVIVFTHRLSLTCLLGELAKKEEIDIQFVSIRWESWGTGNPGDTPINVKRPDRALNNLLNNRLDAARKAFNEEGREVYDPIAKSICSDFRILLERMIEHVLLSNVVHRFRRAVHTQGKILKLSKISSSDCHYFDKMMTKYSKYEHSQSHSTPIQMPIPDELQTDMEGLKDWYCDFSTR